MHKDLLQKAMEYAVKCHADVNQVYDRQYPYSHHLSMVVGVAQDFIHLIPEQYRNDVLAACWCHDLIEDARQTYNDVKDNTNSLVADIVYAVTTEKGKTRADRANDQYYAGIRNQSFATFVKICDRIANYEYSATTKSSMFAKYSAEMPHFKEQLYAEEYDLMFRRLGYAENGESGVK